MTPKTITRALSVTPILALLITGCGGSSSTSASGRQTPAAATTISHPRPPVAHLRVITPRAGAHTGPSLTVRVRLIGGGIAGPRSFLYRLDRLRPRRAGDRLVLRHLDPGRHRLVIRFSDGAQATATVAFVVRAPAPTPAATTPVPAAPTTATATTPAPTTPTATTPPPTTTTPAAPPGGIPQNNGGDQDADNNGGPTDGDGNI